VENSPAGGDAVPRPEPSRAWYLHNARVLGRPLGDVEPTAPVVVLTPNHDHVVDNSRVNANPIWWEVRPVLIMDQSDWPAADGSSGITSSKAMDDAEAAGRAIEVGSNFFLFFSSQMSSVGMNMK
jgi:hypothetical protein